jgi:hypothetical protein
MKRSEEKQREHDLIIHTSFKTWEDRGDVNVYQNPGDEHNFSVAGVYYPDIVVLDKTNNLYLIEEVETEDTVTEEEAKEWKNFANFGVLLNLIVPEEKLEEAKQLSKDITNIRIQTYTFKNGVLDFHL